MTKKLSLAALALVSACYFTACDDDSSSVAASVDEPSSSASVTSSEDKADPESSTTAPKSSASEGAKEEIPESSASEEKPVVKGPCDIDIDSDKWEFEAVGKFKDTFNGSVKVVSVFEGSKATNTMNMFAEFGEYCVSIKTRMEDNIVSEVENVGEQGKVDIECDENGKFTMYSVKIENNVTEEYKKEFHAVAVQACKDAQGGNLDGIFGGSAGEESSSGSQSGDLLSCDMKVGMFMNGETFVSHSCGEAANTPGNKKLLEEECVSKDEFIIATIGTGCPDGAKKICEDDEDGSKIYFYDDDDAVKSCEELLAE